MQDIVEIVSYDDELEVARLNLATTKGKLIESRRTNKTVMILCDGLLAINLFLVILLVLKCGGYL